VSWFAIAFYAALIAASCLAAFYDRRSAFLGVFILTLISFAAGLLGGTDWLVTIAWGLAIFAAAAGLSYSFKAFLVYVLPREASKQMRTAPLTAAFGMLMILLYGLAAIFAPAIAPFGESEVVAGAYAPADEVMILGGDQLGRDLFSRIIYGARNTIGIALVTTGLAFLAGTLFGMLAATRGGWLDQLFGRVADTLMAIPQLVFALLLLTIVGTSVVNLILVIALLYTPLVFRLARAVAGNIVVMDYVEAARLRGESTWHLITREVLPNATAPLVAEFGLRFCFVFLAIAGLSFLGLGIQPPTADWGSMVRDNATLISFGEPTPLIPAAAIALLTVSVNFVVDWMLQRSSGLKS
jgi:peptide/nickel transport system permease protein